MFTTEQDRPVGIVDITYCAANGRIDELRSLPQSVFSDHGQVMRAIAAAAGRGRTEVLRFFAAKGFDLKPEPLLEAAAQVGCRETFSFFFDRGAVVISPALIEIVLRNDRSTILRFWLQKQLASSQRLLADAVRFDALYCFLVLVEDLDSRLEAANVATLTRNLPPRLANIALNRQADIRRSGPTSDSPASRGRSALLVPYRRLKRFLAKAMYR